jgi:hypothetical protein
MADDNKGSIDRFGWTHASDIEYLDDDGNWVRGGEIPDEVKEILKRHDEKVKAHKASPEELTPEPNPASVPAQDSACGCSTEVKRTADKRPRKLPRVQVHIHRGR